MTVSMTLNINKDEEEPTAFNTFKRKTITMSTNKLDIKLNYEARTEHSSTCRVHLALHKECIHA